MTTPRPKRCPTCARHAALGFPHDCGGSTCRFCPWPGCVCTHTAGCDRGFIDLGRDEDGNDVVEKCPNCASAAKDAALLISAGK
jgi:hypothetical protein